MDIKTAIMRLSKLYEHKVKHPTNKYNDEITSLEKYLRSIDKNLIQGTINSDKKLLSIIEKSREVGQLSKILDRIDKAEEYFKNEKNEKRYLKNLKHYKNLLEQRDELFDKYDIKPKGIYLKSYQRYAQKFITRPSQNRGYALFLDMGLGKTLTTLVTLSEMERTGNTLVIAPKNVAKTTWINEIKKWGLKFNVISFLTNDNGKEITKAKREKVYDTVKENTKNLYIINKDKIASLVDYFQEKKYWPFKYIVIDELQNFKNQSTVAFKALKKVIDKTALVIGLTGTPVPNSLTELWGQIYMLDSGKRLGTREKYYRDEYFKVIQYVNNIPTKFVPLKGAEEQIYNKISDIAISVKNTAIKLPELIIKNHEIEMEKDLREQYKYFKEKFVLELGDDIIKANNIRILQTKLIQFTSGYMYTKSTTGIEIDKNAFKIMHTLKLDHLEYLYNNIQDNLLVIYKFKSEVFMIKKRFKDAVINDGSPSIIEKWGQGKIRLLLQHASTSEGLNLQNGSHNIIWMSLPYSLREYQQTNARLYRQGQKHTTYLHHILLKDSVDMGVLKILNRKNITQKELLDALLI